MSQIEPATHEAKGFLYYYPEESHRWDGLDPYWTLGSLLINECDGYQEIQAEIDGEQFDIRLNYSKSGIAPRTQDSVENRLYEFDLHIQGTGERKMHFNISPRFPEMEHYETGEEITTSFHHLDAPEGLSIQFQGANIAHDRIPDLFSRAVFELLDDVGEGLRAEYFTPRGGRISEIERYVRIQREWNRKLIRNDGTMSRLEMLLSQIEGSKGVRKWDNTEVYGYIHQFRYHAGSASELVDTHRFGKQIKSYLTENPKHFDQGDDLYNPKVGALYRPTLNGGRSVPWSERDRLVDELDETLLNILEWADIPTDGRDSVFVSDWHFDAGVRENPVTITADPTPRLEAKQDHLLMTILQDLTVSDSEIVETVATDGGQDVDELAESSGYSISTIYRALARLDGLLESRDGHVRFCSQKIAEEIRGIIEQTESLLESTADRVAQLFDLDVNQSSNSVVDRWLAEYGAEIIPPDSEDDRPTVRFDTLMSELKSRREPYLPDALDELYHAWVSDGRQRFDVNELLVDVKLASGKRYYAPLRTLR